MLHLDLFSGIGGFALAVDTVYGKKAKHIFVENDPFCQAVLKKHWPSAPIHGDIREFVANAHEQRRLHRQPQEQSAKRPHEAQREPLTGTEPPAVFLVTGGFPCQPFSQAGRRKGTADDRYLWPPMFDAIALFRPTWVIAENVAGLVTWNDGMVLETVCTDLESEGYEVQPFIIPAVAVGAPHRRDRVWIVSHRTSGGARGSECEGSGGGQSEATVRNRNSDASDATKRGRRERHAKRGGVSKRKGALGSKERRGSADGGRFDGWQEDWPQAATRLCTVDDGLSNGLVRPRGWRNAALKAAGNAIVPQVAMEILHAIKSS